MTNKKIEYETIKVDAPAMEIKAEYTQVIEPTDWTQPTWFIFEEWMMANLGSDQANALRMIVVAVRDAAVDAALVEARRDESLGENRE